MLVYIAYKYTHIKDKEALKEQLKVLADIIRSTRNKTFLLIRDVKKWGHDHSSFFQTVPQICFNIFKSDVVFVFISSEVKSSGMEFEILCARLFGKKVIVAVKDGIKTRFRNSKNTNVFVFKSLDDLEKQIKGHLANSIE